MLPVSLSVMKSSRPSLPPRQRLVVEAPAQEAIPSVGSARGESRQTVPTPVCGKDLNREPHEHQEEVTDSRWAALVELRDRL